MANVSMRDRIKQSSDITSETVDVPQWDVKLEVRSMKGGERARMLMAVNTGEKMDFEKFYPEIIIATCYDPDTGERVFEPGDTEWLNDKSSAALEKLARVGMKLSGMGEDAVDEAGKLS